MGQINRVEGEDHVPEVREPGGYRHSDADIGRELRECLADDVGLDSRGIEVEVKNGEVTLSGAVRQLRRYEARRSACLCHPGRRPGAQWPAAEGAVAGAPTGTTRRRGRQDGQARIRALI